MNSFEKGMLAIIIVLGILITISIIDPSYYHPAAAENAKQECLERGFDYADNFQRMPFTTNPLGTKCKYAYNIETKGGDS